MIYACLNDCIIYRNEYIDFSSSLVYGDSRWKKTSNGNLKMGMPTKVVWNFQPIHHFQLMSKSKEI